MGLDTSHGCWNDPYSSFMRWRIWLAKESGIPLLLMEGFYGWIWGEGDIDFSRDYGPIHSTIADPDNAHCRWETLYAMSQFGKAIPWNVIKSPLVPLLRHSDCGGKIRFFECLPIARGLRDTLLKCEDDTKWPLNEETNRPLWTNWRDGRADYDGNVPATKRFIRGLLDAHRRCEDVRFH